MELQIRLHESEFMYNAKNKIKSNIETSAVFIYCKLFFPVLDTRIYAKRKIDTLYSDCYHNGKNISPILVATETVIKCFLQFLKDFFCIENLNFLEDCFISC